MVKLQFKKSFLMPSDFTTILDFEIAFPNFEAFNYLYESIVSAICAENFSTLFLLGN